MPMTYLHISREDVLLEIFYVNTTIITIISIFFNQEFVENAKRNSKK